MSLVNMSRLDVIHENGNTEQKRKIIGSVFPKKLEFDGIAYRTAKSNNAIEIMFVYKRDYEAKKRDSPVYF